MTETEKKLILDLILNKVSPETFHASYPIALSQYPDYFLKVIEEALLTKNSKDIEYVLMLVKRIGPAGKYHLSLKKLILEDWHNQHENIIDILASFKDETDAVYFYHVLKSTYDYIEDVEDFLVPIWIKCIWALGKINTPEAKEFLTEFKNSEYESIREAVLHQFKRNKWS